MTEQASAMRRKGTEYVVFLVEYVDGRTALMPVDKEAIQSGDQGAGISQRAPEGGRLAKGRHQDCEARVRLLIDRATAGVLSGL
jgi:hypothetical protein